MAEFELTALGTSPAFYNPGEAGSGYLLTADGYRVLLDCGGGAFSRYLEVTDEAPHSVVISHMHGDHILDLVPFKYGMMVGDLQHWPKPELWLPPDGAARLQQLVKAWDGVPSFFSDNFEMRRYEPDEQFRVGPFEVRAQRVPHFIDSYALRFDHSSGSFGYSSDLGPDEGVCDLVDGVDLFLCEATLDSTHEESESMRGHLTASEAGEIAQKADVRSLLLTHIPVALGRDKAVEAARSAYNGPIAAAQEKASYPVAAHLAQVS